MREEKRTKLFLQLALRLDRAGAFHARAPRHAELGEHVAQLLDLLRRCEPVEDLGPLFAHAAGEDDGLCSDKKRECVSMRPA